MIWENMENKSRGIRHSKSYFQMTINYEWRSFLWQRTRDSADGVQGVGKMIHWNYKLVDKRTGEVLAVYLDDFFKSWLKKGKLKLKADLGKGLGAHALARKSGTVKKRVEGQDIDLALMEEEAVVVAANENISLLKCERTVIRAVLSGDGWDEKDDVFVVSSMISYLFSP